MKWWDDLPEPSDDVVCGVIVTPDDYAAIRKAFGRADEYRTVYGLRVQVGSYMPDDMAAFIDKDGNVLSVFKLRGGTE